MFSIDILKQFNMGQWGFIIILLLGATTLNGQIIKTIAGNGSIGSSGDGGPATAAKVNNPCFGDFDKYGNYYFADYLEGRVRKIDVLGIITTVAGGGSGGLGDGGPATAATFNHPLGVKLDTSGNIYIVDVDNHRVRKVNAATGIISTIVGTGTPSFSGDNGPATAAALFGPQDIAVDYSGNVYVSDLQNQRIRKVSSGGIITTFAGTGISGYSGDGGAATLAQINYPEGLAVDNSGNLYIADAGSFSSRIRKVNVTTGVITSVVGNGSTTYVGDGIAATAASIAPLTIFIDKFNNMYISDKYNIRVYKVEAASGKLYSIAGNGTSGDSGDGGPATAANLSYPNGVAVDLCGNVYITNPQTTSIPGIGRRIRKITYNPPPCDYLTVGEQYTPKISIYPNPINEELHIDNAKSGTSYDVITLVGSVLQSGTLKQGVNTISTKELPPGLYLLQLTDGDGGRTVLRVIKE